MKFVLALTLVAASFTASATNWPRLPRVNIGAPCRVLLIDNWHRRVAAYNGRRDIFSGQCAQPMNQCRRDLYSRRNRNGLRCVDERGRW